MTPRLLAALAAWIAARDQWRGENDPTKDYGAVRNEEIRAEAELREAFEEYRTIQPAESDANSRILE